MQVVVLVNRKRTGKVGEVIDFPNHLVSIYEKKGLIKRKEEENERYADDTTNQECEGLQD